MSRFRSCPVSVGAMGMCSPIIDLSIQRNPGRDKAGSVTLWLPKPKLHELGVTNDPGPRRPAMEGRLALWMVNVNSLRRAKSKSHLLVVLDGNSSLCWLTWLVFFSYRQYIAIFVVTNWEWTFFSFFLIVSISRYLLKGLGTHQDPNTLGSFFLLFSRCDM